MASQSSKGKSGPRWWDVVLMIVGTPTLALLIWLWLRRRAERKTAPSVRFEIAVQTRSPQPPQPEEQLTPDDLKRIEGIGPKTAGVLQAAGVTTFAQLAAADVEHLKAILKAAGIRANPGAWPEQASLAAAGQWDALKALQAKLKRGRRA
jgi:predicted flap endonuclease-1-like 5' DNA nuclease